MTDKPRTPEHIEHEQVINNPNYITLAEMHLQQLATIEAQAGVIALLDKRVQELLGIEVIKH